MASVGVKELKNRLTHYLRRTKLGEELVVTEEIAFAAADQRLLQAAKSEGLRPLDVEAAAGA